MALEYVMYEMSIDCPGCGAPVHVNGPFRSVTCARCSTETPLGDDFWEDILKDSREAVLEELEEGEGTKSTIFGSLSCSMLYGDLVPYCRQCKRDFDIDADMSEGGVLVCPSCDIAVPVTDPPEWVRSMLKGAEQVVGAERPGSEEPEEASEPVALFCPQCAGSLMVDGTDRLVKCEYCDTSIYLPDDLWFRLHPVKVKTRWFIGFQP